MTTQALTFCLLVLLGIGAALDLPWLWRRRRTGELTLFAAFTVLSLAILLAWSQGWPWPNPNRLIEGIFGPLGRSLFRPLE